MYFGMRNAERTLVELQKQNGRVIVRIRDYGKGFPTSIAGPIENNVGVGIAGMRERIRR
jgi:signal transduction histidine kinase